MPTDWRLILSTKEINCNDEFDENEYEGCADDCDIYGSRWSGQNLKGISRFGRVHRAPKYLNDYC